MALATNSYSSVADVQAFTRHLLEGDATFTATTRPTKAEVEGFIDDVSGELNSAIASSGFAVPITQTDALSSCQLWVRTRAAMLVELTQRGAGWSDDPNSRVGQLRDIAEEAQKFVNMKATGWAALGVTRTTNASEGLAYTALNKHSERADPDSTTLEQPAFRRRQFDR